ncbi:putative cyclin domain-containing protein [Helianthus annuus]|nr:putative cyclin domain-containing protein [Helianthus annuus]
MKNLRSNIPRRKRSNFSPIFIPSVARKLDSTSFAASSSNLTRDVAFSCDDSSSMSTNNKSLKKRSFSDRNDDGFGEFRRITRSYSQKFKVELSEVSSCVELCDSSSKKLIRKGDAALRYSDNADDEVSVSVAVSAIEKSEVTTRSECSVFQKEVTNGRDSHKNEENDVVSVSSRRDSPEAKFGTTSFNLSNTTINDGESALKSTNITVNDDETENCGESKLISAEIDLTCSEQLYGGDEVSGYSSAGCTDGNIESSEFEISSGFFTPSWFDSGSQFSERSIGDPTPSPTFQLFLVYRQKFCKSEFDTNISSDHFYKEPSNGTIKLLRPEDEEHEESYQMMKVRERRQVYLHDYAEEYCGMTECGDLVVQQRLQMVHWIMEQSASKDLRKETMFLGVSLLDRFLSKGYFRSKKELEIAGIACLTLAIRIEENQPYNSIQQKLFNVGSNEYSRSEVVAMEWLVQDVLNFQCYLPTIYNFLWFYLKAARSDEEVDKTAKYLAVLALLGHEQLCYWPSTVAASLVSLACLAGDEQSSLQQIAWIHNGSNDKDLPECIESLEWLVQHI